MTIATLILTGFAIAGVPAVAALCYIAVSMPLNAYIERKQQSMAIAAHIERMRRPVLRKRQPKPVKALPPIRWTIETTKLRSVSLAPSNIDAFDVFDDVTGLPVNGPFHVSR